MVDNIPNETTWKELKDNFRRAGTVKYCTVRVGVGRVEFATKEGMENALSTINNTEFGGNLIQVYEERKEDRETFMSR